MKKIWTILAIMLIGGAAYADNYSLNFNGTDNYVSIADNSSLDLTSTYTIEAWIYPESFGFLDGIVSKYQTSASLGFTLRLSGDSPYTGINFDEQTTASGILSANNWYHVAAVNASGTRKLYINGAEQSLSETPLSTQSNSDPVRIGCDFSERYFDGKIDEVRIWNTARTQTQIQENMNKELTGSESGLVAYYKMSDGSGTTLTDDTGHSHNGTISGATWTISNDLSLPVELSSFSAHTEGRSIILNWITESETDNLGFILERSVEADYNPPGEAGSGWQTIASYQTHQELKGQGNISSRTEYSFTDKNVESGKSYFYRLSDVSTKGKITVYSSLSVKMDNLPETTEMENAYPNPFNPQTYIAYHLAEDSNVSITVFDMLGRQVKSLFNGHQVAGSYNVYWNATDAAGNKVPSGGYIIQMKTANARQTQKVMLMK